MAKILIVDDDLETTKLFEGILNSGGHIASSVTESKDCVPAVQTFEPDLILLDIMMANINGIEICKFLKSEPDFRHIPVVMVSALSDEGSKRDSINAGADDFIVKPIMPTNFLTRINSFFTENN